MTTTTTTTISTTAAATVDVRFDALPVDVIDPDPANPARPVDAAFAAAIAQHGVLQPIIVTPTDDGRHRIVDGERRWRAAQAAGHTTIASVVRSTEGAQAGVWQAVANLARSDFAPSQEALAVARIMGEGVKQKALAATLNRPLSWVRARITLAALPDNVQQAIDRGDFDVSDAATFAKYSDRPVVVDAVIEQPPRDLERALEHANRRYETATEINRLYDDYTQRGIAVHRVELPDDLTNAKPLSHLHGIDSAAHEAEPCHVVVIGTGWAGIAVKEFCADPKRHSARGDSSLTATKPKRSDAEQAELDEAKASRARKQHRNEFAAEAIRRKVRAKDLGEMVLPILIEFAGQAELTAAAKLLGVTEPDTDGPSGHKDWAGPFRAWACETTANQHRAAVAIAYVQAVGLLDHDYLGYSDTARQALRGWLDQLGYEPPDQ